MECTHEKPFYLACRHWAICSRISTRAPCRPSCPSFISEYHLSYAAAAGLVAALSIASTVIQPLFGFYADRLSKPWLIPAGVGMAGCGVAFSTLLPDYWFAIAMIVLSGIGIAAFHPEGARLVHYHAGEKKATAMSVFAVGGQTGIALGPIMAAVVVSAWGLRGTAFLAIPFLLMAAFLAFQLTGTGGGHAGAKSAAGSPGERKENRSVDSLRDPDGRRHHPIHHLLRVEHLHPALLDQRLPSIHHEAPGRPCPSCSGRVSWERCGAGAWPTSTAIAGSFSSGTRH